ncbi:FadR/GntR family transcriptional regulator [Metabacillus litoralis]|jgi:GntR family transcriptional regulator, transcriptional repressor for pyruvate dehydrogenase complex|uniref:FadR/GntR family transcriptional regulator n=1 Tax=Metabacillus litoralis TaxID=152268 RepID=UPI00203B4F0B|nr:FadR/GntR family transcriptional regulator [Metabacillus litoralis]MCM3653429.1 FadR family transcriptional regulator [Metabacillus litoralis]
MEPLKMTTVKIYEKIAEHLKQQILDGKLKPGERLPSDKELCQLYSVGRSTIREALSALKIMGLVESRQGEGSTICKVDPEDIGMPDFTGLLLSEQTILELMEARKSLEISNVELAASKRLDLDLKKFQQIIAQMEVNLLSNKESEKEDMLFHHTIAKATQNSIMVRLLDTISEQMEKAMKEIRRMGFSNPSSANIVLEEHRNIYQAIVEQDVEKAQKNMKNHLEHFECELRNYMKLKNK